MPRQFSGNAQDSPTPASAAPAIGGTNAEHVSDDRLDEALQERGDRAAFVLARKGEDPLQSPVFESGESKGSSEIAVFTERNTAHLYLQAARCDESHEPIALPASSLADWFRALQERGVESVKINPNRQEEEEGWQQCTVPVQSLAEYSGEEIYGRLRDLAITSLEQSR